MKKAFKKKKQKKNKKLDKEIEPEPEINKKEKSYKNKKKKKTKIEKPENDLEISNKKEEKDKSDNINKFQEEIDEDKMGKSTKSIEPKELQKVLEQFKKDGKYSTNDQNNNSDDLEYISSSVSEKESSNKDDLENIEEINDNFFDTEKKLDFKNINDKLNKKEILIHI